RLTVGGTSGDDQFLLRAGFVAALENETSPGVFTTAELVTYDVTINGGLTLNALAGDDHVAFDDNSTLTTVNGGTGADTFQVGQLFGTVNNVDTAFVSTTRGELSNGISFSTTINGGDGPDRFIVFHNLAVLQLNGGRGDDEFVIRTFLDADEETRISSGAGRDLISYVMNAPVSIDGGDGFDTVVIIGTEANDDFVINTTGVYGAGRFVAFIGVERVDVDGAEGDDTFTVLATAAGVQVRIFGGPGSDTVIVAGDAPTVFADDLLGHTGLISHSVESTDGTWDGTAVDGIAAEILDDDEAAIGITETEANTLVWERTIGTSDAYDIALTSAPTHDVRVTVVAPSRSPEDETDRSYSVEVSSDGVTWASAVTLVFTPGNWNVAQTVQVRAFDDLSSEGERIAFIQHLVVSDDTDFNGLALLNIPVRVIDDERAGIVVVEAGGGTTAGEDGSTGEYDVHITRDPLQDVDITIGGDGQICVSTSTDANPDCGPVTFTATSAGDSVRIFVRAAVDTTLESFHVGYASQTLASSETYGGGVTAVAGTRFTVFSTQAFAAGDLRGYLLRIVSGSSGGLSWDIWDNLASTTVTGGYETVITIQGDAEFAPGVTDSVVIAGYAPPAADSVLEGSATVSASDPLVLDITGLVLPTADGGLSGATIRVFAGDTTEFRTIVSNTASTITIDTDWTIAPGTAFSIIDISGISARTVGVLVSDDDAPGVTITQSDGSTRLAEGPHGATTGLGYDTYDVALTRDPGSETVTITIQPEATETLHQPDGDAGYRFVPQVWVGTSATTAMPSCLATWISSGGEFPDTCDLSIELTFNTSNWTTAQTVYVFAIDDSFVDGSDLQAFADSAQRVHLI
ncbi:MAG: hypothetical protein U9R51_06270, partial [Actinomycetota bacterium]|nr:hypothetical protein [Actinomycetota bacterium]